MQEPLDRSVIDGLVDDLGDRDTVRAVAEVYLGQLPTRLGELHAGWPGDPDTCRRVAHSLKSASAALGLGGVARVCRALEQAADGGPDAEPDAVPALLRELDDVAGPAETHLRAWLSDT